MPSRKTPVFRFVGAPGNHNKEDQETICSLQKKVFGEVYRGPKQIQHSYWWLLEVKGIAIGFCGLYIYSEEEDPECAFLCLSGVLPEYRGQGLQRRMIRHRVRYAKEHGVKRVITYTSYDNLPSANNLIRCGFRLYAPRWLWGVSHAYYLQKLI